jgi:hypothetical protein
VGLHTRAASFLFEINLFENTYVHLLKCDNFMSGNQFLARHIYPKRNVQNLPYLKREI